MGDIDKTIPPRREHISSGADDVTMPGKRDRKPDGRFAVGDLIMNRYKVLAELGQGGMGVVYRCLDETAGIEVALKALPPELSHNTLEMEDIKENFQLVAKLVHQNIAISKQLERDDCNGNYYLIMECCEGEDLRRWIKRKRKEGPLTLDDVLPIIRQVADALDYAHSEKIIHRDIKPGNIMITSRGKVKVLDFGLAAQIHTSMTRVSMAYHGTSGTGPYMAPEQWRGRAQGAPADQYTLAVMTYEMLAGHLPFESTDASVLREVVLNDTPEKVADIPKAAQEAISRAMSKEPAERFASCSDFATALGGTKIKAVKKQSKGRFPKWAAVFIIAVLLGAGGTGYYFFDQHQKEQARLEQLAVEKEQKINKTLSAAQEAKAKSQWQDVLRLSQSVLQLDATNQHAKSLQDEAKQQIAEIEKQKEKQRISALKSETYRLLNRIREQKTKIESDNHDRGQTFGQYLDSLKENFGTGETALKNNDFQTANTSFKAAKKAAEWLEKNALLREEAKKLQTRVAELKMAADRFNSSRLASSSYNEADSLIKKANEDYESGNFGSAKSKMQLALTGYQTAYTQARKLTVAELERSIQLAQSNKQWNKIKELAEKFRQFDTKRADELIESANQQSKMEKLNSQLNFARNAKNSNDWEKVLRYSKNALQIDPGNRTAQTLQEEAYSNLPSGIRIIAIVDGRRVPATVTIGKEKFIAGEIFDKLKKQQKYRCVIVGNGNYSDYIGKCEFTFNWRGPRNYSVVLQNWKDAVERDRKRGIKFSADGKTLIKYPYNIYSNSYEIPFGVTTIGERAFLGQSYLKNVIIPYSVTAIGSSAFFSCTKLLDIKIPDSVTVVGDMAFHSCYSLKTATIGAGVIGDGAFEKCNLTKVILGDSVHTIGRKAFYLHRTLSSVLIGNGVKHIGEHAFDGCEKLTSITIPNSVETIDNYAFADCSNLKYLTIGKRVKRINGCAFYKCVNLSEVVIPGSATILEHSIFSGCENLKYVTIKYGVKNISNSAFDNCRNLSSVAIPKSVTKIGMSAFNNCSNLMKILIPNSVKSVGYAAFEGAGCEEQVKRDYPHLYK